MGKLKSTRCNGLTAAPMASARPRPTSRLLKNVLERSGCARLIQHSGPWRTKDSAPRGPGFENCASLIPSRVFQQPAKGVGKGTLVRCLQRIFGAHAFQVTSREEVIGKFNSHLQDCVLFIADEAYWGGDKRCVGRLQGMITEGTLPIERKGIDLIQVPNYLHVMMLAEPGWVIPAGKYERRYAALEVSSARRGAKSYFRALHRQINEGGAEAMFYDLQRMELGDWHPRDIPETLLRNPALLKQQGFNLPPLEQWYVSILHDGVLPGSLANRPNTAFTKNLLDDAKERVPRLKWDLTEVALRNFLVDEIGIPCSKFRARADS